MKKFFIFTLIILFLTKTQNIFTKEDTFAVDNIVVSGKIKNNNYRDSYLQLAFQKGFEKLIYNILKKNDHKKLLSTNLETIKSLIETYRIVEEKVEDGNFDAKVDIIFNREMANNFFNKQNISYSEVTKLEIMVYPILIQNSELQLFSKNKFFEEWNETNTFENINFLLPVENLEDIEFVKNNLTVLEEIELDKLLSNYEIKNRAILILRHDKNKLNAFLKINFKGSKKSKSLLFNVENLENKDARAEIIRNLKIYINDFWKEQNLIDISVPSYLTVSTKLNKPETLNAVINKFKEINLIKSYKIKELDNNSAKIQIKYFGSVKSLKDSFISNGFKFKILHNEWSLALAT